MSYHYNFIFNLLKGGIVKKVLFIVCCLVVFSVNADAIIIDFNDYKLVSSFKTDGLYNYIGHVDNWND